MLLHEELTKVIIDCFYRVYNQLGYGFLEKVYENAFVIELRKQGLIANQQQAISVYYDDIEVGNYFADIIVEDTVILELKADTDLAKAHEVQLSNYLKATKIEVGLLFNFGEKPVFKRRLFTNDLK